MSSTPDSSERSVLLSRTLLKKLRKKAGFSQEELANRCADARLCVSIASIKRAETNKPVLLRTARDIARFYKVQLEEIVVDEGAAHSSLPELRFRKKFLALYVLWHSSSEALNQSIGEWLNSHSFSRNIQSLTQHYAVILLGEYGESGDQIYGASQLVRHLKAELGETFANTPFTLALALYDLDSDPNLVVEEIQHVLPECKQSSSIIELPLAISWLPDIHQGGNELWCELSDLKHLAPARETFVAREMELYQCEILLQSVKRNQSINVILIRGVAGIGKSRFLNELRCKASDLSYHNAHAYTLDFGELKHLSPWLTVLLDMYGYEQIAGSDMSVLCEKIHIDAVEDSYLVATLQHWAGVDLPVAYERILESMAPQARLNAKCELLAKAISAASQSAPVLIAIEDIHWADDEFFEILQQLSSLLDSGPLLICLTTRIEQSASKNIELLLHKTPVLAINLTPFSKAESYQLSEQYQHIPVHYRERCVEKAQGNALYLNQLLRNYQQSSEELPESIRSLAASKLNTLQAKDATAAMAASIIGQVIPLDLLRHIIGEQEYDPTELISHYFIEREKGEFRFTHALIREGIYQSLMEEQKQKMHEVCAQWYQSQKPILFIRHLHFARSPLLPGSLLKVLQHLAEDFEFSEAYKLISLVRNNTYCDLDSGEFFSVCATVYFKLGKLPDAIAAYQQALQKAEFFSLLEVANLHIDLAISLNTLDRYDEAVQQLNLAEKLAQGDLNLLARIFYCRGNFEFPKGHVQACFDFHEKALECARQGGNPELEARTLGGLGDAAYAQGRYQTAFSIFEKCVSLAREKHYQDIEAANSFMLGTVRIYQNQLQLALDDVAASISAARITGNKRSQVVSHLTAAWIYAEMLQLDKARLHVNSGMVLVAELGAKRFEPFLSEVEARIHLYGEKTDLALAVIEKALQQVNKLEIHHFIGPWLLSTKALIMAKRICADAKFNVHDAEEVHALLDEGAKLLKEGCVGHNYYRYWVQALDALLLLGDKEKALVTFLEFKQYAEKEPVPWSDYYIQRFALLIDGSQLKAGPWRAHEERSKMECFHASLKLAESICESLRLHSNVATP